MGSGNITSVEPVSHVAWMAVISGRVVGPRTATWASGPAPCPDMTAARLRASSWVWAHVVVS